MTNLPTEIGGAVTTGAGGEDRSYLANDANFTFVKSLQGKNLPLDAASVFIRPGEGQARVFGPMVAETAACSGN